jgi:hypothetical protein
VTKYSVISFDTSSHNRLIEGGPVSEAILAGIQLGLYFRFVGQSVEEMFGCPNDEGKREALFTYSRRLQNGPNDCIYAHGELLRLHITAHNQSPKTYDWKKVDVRAREYERGIQQRGLVLDDELSELQRKFKVGKEYDRVLLQLRTKLAEICEAHGEAPPLTFREAMRRAEAGNPNLVLSTGKILYDYVAKGSADEETIREFMAACPPFRALIYAFLMRWYDRALKGEKPGEKYKAQCSDLFMASHLPYCDKFITAEKLGEQEKCLREIAAIAGLETQVLSYDDFCDSFLVTA